MKKLIGLGVLLIACRGSTPPNQPTPSAGAGGTGAATPGAAVAAFMSAAKAQDLQAFGAVWGSAEGSARETMTRSEFEMRAIYTVKCLRHDTYAVLSEAGAEGGKRVMNVQLTAGALTRATTFTLVPGPQNRWYVQIVDPAPLNDICLLR